MKKNLKWVIIGIVSIVLIITAILIGINVMKFSYKIEEIKDINYMVVVHNKKSGVLNKNGETVIDTEYEAVQIPNPSKPVFICSGEYDNEKKEYKTKVLNERKEELFTQYEKVQVIPIETNIDKTLYERSVLEYQKDGKYGLIDLDGKEITKPIYDEINSVNYKEGTFFVKQNEKWGVINKKGKVIIKPEYETITSDNYYNEKTNSKNAGYIISKKTQDRLSLWVCK